MEKWNKIISKQTRKINKPIEHLSETSNFSIVSSLKRHISTQTTSKGAEITHENDDISWQTHTICGAATVSCNSWLLILPLYIKNLHAIKWFSPLFFVSFFIRSESKAIKQTEKKPKMNKTDFFQFFSNKILLILNLFLICLINSINTEKKRKFEYGNNS